MSQPPPTASNVPSVAVVFPVFDGEATRRVVAALPRDVCRRVIVVGGSIEGAETVARAGGWAGGCMAAREHLRSSGERPEVVVLMDGRCDPAQLMRVAGPIVRGEGRMVVGSRRMRRQAANRIPIPRAGLNWAACRIIQLLTGKVYTDVGPMRAMTWELFERLAGTRKVAMQFKAPRMGVKVIEVPVD